MDNDVPVIGDMSLIAEKSFDNMEQRSVSQTSVDKETIIDLKTQLVALQTQLEGLQNLTSRNDSSWRMKHDELVIQCEKYKSENLVLQDKLNTDLKLKSDVFDLEGKCDVEQAKQMNNDFVIQSENELHTLKDEIRSQTSWSDEVMGECATLKQTVTATEKETTVVDLMEQCDTLKQTVTEKETIVADLIGQCDTLKQTVTEKETTVVDLIGQCDTLKQTVTEKETTVLDLMGQCDTLKQAVTEKETTVVDLMGQCDMLKQTVVEKETTVADLIGQCDTLKQTVTEKDTEVVDLMGQCDMLKQTVTEKETTVADLMGQCDTLKHAVTEKETTVADLMGQCDTLKHAVTEKETTVADLMGQCDTLKQTVTEKETTVADLMGQCDTLKQTVTEKETTVADLMGQCDTLKHAVTERETIVVDLTGQCDTLKQTVAENETIVVDLMGRCDTLKQTVTEKETTVADLMGQCDTLKQTVTEKETTVADLMGQCDTLKHTVTEKETIVVNLTGQCDALKQTVTENETIVVDLMGQCDTLKQTVTEKETTVADLMGQCDTLEHAVTEKETTVADLMGQCDTLKLTVTEKETTVADLMGQCDTLKHAVTEKETIVVDLTGQCDTLKQTVAENETIVVDLMGQCDTLKQTVTERETTVADLIGQCDTHTQTVAEREATVVDLMGQCDILKQTVTEKETRIVDLMTQLKDLQALRSNNESSWEDKHTEAVQLCEQYKCDNLLLRESLEKLEKDMEVKSHTLFDAESKCEELQQEKQFHSFKVVDLENQLQILKVENEEQASRFDDSERLCETLTKRLSEKESIITDLNTGMESLQALISKNESMWQVKYDEVVEQKQKHLSENEVLQGTLEKLNVDLDVKSGLLSDLDKRHKEISEELQQEKQLKSGSVMDLEKQLQTLKGEVDAQTSGYNDLVVQCGNLTESVMEKETSITHFKTQLEDLQTLMSKGEDSWQVKHDEVTHQCDKYKSENLLLQDCLKKLDVDFEAKCGLLFDLKKKYENVSADLQDKCYELIMALTDKQFYIDMAMNLEKKVQALKGEMEVQHSNFDNLESKWIALNEDYLNKENEIVVNVSLLSDARKKCEQLTQELKDKEVEFCDVLEVKNSLLVAMESNCEQLSKELQDKSYELIISLSEKQLNSDLASDLEKQVQNLKFEIECKTTSFDDLETQWMALKEENLGQQKELSTTKLLLAALEDKHDQLALQLQNKETEFHAVATDNLSKDNKISQMQNDMHTLMGDLQSRASSIEEMEEANATLKQHVLIEQEKLSMQSKLNDQRCEELEAMKENDLSKRTEAQVKLDNLEKAVMDSKADLEAERRSCEQLRQEVDDLKTNLIEYQNLTKSHMLELEGKMKIQEQTENKLDLLQKDIAQKNEELVQKETKIRELKERLQYLEHTYSGTEKEVENGLASVEKKAELGNMTSSISKDVEMYGTGDDTVAGEMSSNNTHVEFDSKHHLSQKLECLTKENESLKKERLEKNLNEECLKAELAYLKGDMSSSKLCNESFRTHKFEVNEQLWNLTVEKEAVQKQLDQTRNELEEVKLKFETYKIDEMDVTNLKEKLVQSQFDIAELRCQLDYIESEKSLIEEEFGASKQENMNLTVELQSIKDKNMALAEHLQELRTSETNLNNEATKNSAELNDMQEQYKNLHNMLAKAGPNASKGSTRKAQTTLKNVKGLSKSYSKSKLDIANDVKNVTAEKEILEEKLAGLETELSEVKKSFEERNQSMETDQNEKVTEILQEQVNGFDLQCQLHEIQTEKCNIEIERNNLLEKNKELADDYQRVQNQNKILEQKMEEFSSAAQDVGNDLRKLHDVVRDQNESLTKKRKEIVVKANEIETLRVDLAELFSKIQEKQKEIDSLTDEVSKLKNEMKESKSNLGTLEDVVESLNFEIASTEDDKSSLTLKLESAEEKIKALQNELQLVNKSIEEKGISNKDQIASSDLSELKNTVEDLNNDNKELSSKLKEINEVEKALRKDVQHSQEALRKKCIECEDLILQIAESKLEIAESVEKITSIQEELLLSQQQLSELELEVKGKDEEMWILQKENQKAFIDSDTKDLEITNLMKMKEDLSSQLQSKQKELILISDEKDLIVQQYADETKKCELLKSNTESLHCQLMEKEKQLNSILKKDKDSSVSLENVKASFTSELKEKQDEINQLLQSQQNAQKQLTDIENNISELKQEIKNRDDKIQQLSSNLSSVCDELQQNKCSKDDANIKVQKLQQDLEEQRTMLSKVKDVAEKMERENDELSKKLLETQSTSCDQESGKDVLRKWEQRCKDLDSNLTVERRRCQGLTDQINSLKACGTGDTMKEMEDLKSELNEVKKDRDCMRDERQQIFQKAKEHKDKADLLSCRIRVLTHRLKKQEKGSSQPSAPNNKVDNKHSEKESPISDIKSDSQTNKNQCLSKTDNVCKSPPKVSSSVPSSSSGLKLCSPVKQSIEEKSKIAEVVNPMSIKSSPSLQRVDSAIQPTKKLSPLSLRKRTSKLTPAPNLQAFIENKKEEGNVQTTSELRVQSLQECQEDPTSSLKAHVTRTSMRKRNSSQSLQTNDNSSQDVPPNPVKEQPEPVMRTTRSTLRKRESTESLPSVAGGKKSKVIYEDPVTWLESSSKQAKVESTQSVIMKSKPSSSCDVAGPATRSKARETTAKVLNPITNSPVKDSQHRPKGFLRQTHKMSERKAHVDATQGKDEAAQTCNTQ